MATLLLPLFPLLSCFYLKRPIIKSFNKTLRCTAEDSERLELKTTNTLVVSPGRGGASGKICSRGHGGAEGNPPTPSVPPGRADFGGINGNSSSYSSEDSRTSSGNDGGDFPALARRPARDLEAFGELPALQSGHTRSQSRGLAMGASCADDLSAYAMRAMEAEKPMEEKAAEVERAHDSLLEEQPEKAREWLEKLERRGIGPRARGIRGCRVGRQGQ